MSLIGRFRDAWNAFLRYDTYERNNYVDYGMASYYRPDRSYFTKGNERSIVASVYNRISIDCASVVFKHVRLDEDGRFKEEIKDELNDRLNFDANLDQTSKSFFQDAVQSMFDEGVVALVPIDYEYNSIKREMTDIYTMRVGRILEWYPEHIRVEVYNQTSGKKEEITVLKKDTAIIENPFYSVVNEKNSVAQRLIKKLNILDAIDEQTGSGKLDLIVQLPYVIKSEAMKERSKRRSEDIENQLRNSKFGIAYIDGTEKVTQLNRPVENNVMSQVDYLTSMLYSQLSINQKILDGTASPQELHNYMTNTIKPIVAAFVDEMKRKFLTCKQRKNNESIIFNTEPFKIIPITQLADLADKFTRNEIMSPNEIRQIVGLKPVEDPKADELRNRNINSSEEQEFADTNEVSSESNGG